MGAAQGIDSSMTDALDGSVEATAGGMLEAVLAEADGAFSRFSGSDPATRIGVLEALTALVSERADELLRIAMAETGLGAARLIGELARNLSELRFFTDVIGEGSYLEASVDAADPAATPPVPEVRRYLRSRGPVLIYAASNFPFAFGTLGCDTASALASGSSVVIKSHPGHPRLSDALSSLMRQVIEERGLPDGVFGIVHGDAAGVAALHDHRTKACAFTGTARAGAMLASVAASRPDPIPFYGEFGSINPVVVTPGAERARGDELVRAFVSSYTDSAGQKCTKPGLLFVPVSSSLADRIAILMDDLPAQRMLTDRMARQFDARAAEFANRDDVSTLVNGFSRRADDAAWMSPTLYLTTADAIFDDPDGLLQEHFGPSATIVTYRTTAELTSALAALPGSLTGAVQGAPGDEDEFGEVIALLAERVGRFIWNDWPPGLAINWSQHHGGPWPATTDAGYTSVGATSIRRWLRPIAFQSAPEALLPAPVHPDNPWAVPLRVDGKLALS